MWKIIKKFIGQDLSKVSVPVILAEPLSVLQRNCEILLQYEDLVVKAAECPDSTRRLAITAIHSVSGYNDMKHRHKKFFNPILGETYELVTDKYRFISE